VQSSVEKMIRSKLEERREGEEKTNRGEGDFNNTPHTLNFAQFFQPSLALDSQLLHIHNSYVSCAFEAFKFRSQE